MKFYYTVSFLTNFLSQIEVIHLGILEIKIYECFKGTVGITTPFMNTYIQLKAQWLTEFLAY
jgi:hypothetical protein